MRWLVGLIPAFILLAQEPPAAGPAQPIPYSHALHAGKLELKCSQCHENKDPGETMGIPATAKCMACHQAIKSDAEPIKKLKAYYDAKRDVPWLRVYQVPGYVFFSHRAHLQAGAECKTCHGDVAASPVLKRETDISMGGCMNCHRQSKAPLNCTFCHEQRN